MGAVGVEHDGGHCAGVGVDRAGFEHAEGVALGIGQHDPVHAPLADVEEGGTPGPEPGHGGLLVGQARAGQVEVDAALPHFS